MRHDNETVTPLDTWLKIAVDGDPDGMLGCDVGHSYLPRSDFPEEVSRIERLLAQMAEDGKYLRGASGPAGGKVDEDDDPFPKFAISASEYARADGARKMATEDELAVWRNRKWNEVDDTSRNLKIEL